MKIETINFINKKFAKEIKESKGKFKILWQNNKTAEIPTEIEFDEDIAWLHGFWVGDRGDNRNFAFANTNYKLIKIIYKILIDKLKLNPSRFTLKINLNEENLNLPKVELNVKIKKTFIKGWRQKSPYYYVLIAGTLTPLLNLFKDIEVNLIEYLKSVDRNIRNHWYAGFFDAEGPITSRGVGWNSSNSELNKKIANLLKYDRYANVRMSNKEIWIGQPSRNLIRTIGIKEAKKICELDLLKFSKEILTYSRNDDYRKRASEYINKTYLTKDYRKFLEKIKIEFNDRRFSLKEFEKFFKTKNGSYILPTLSRTGFLARKKVGNKFLYWLPTPEDPARGHCYPGSTKPC